MLQLGSVVSWVQSKTAAAVDGFLLPALFFRSSLPVRGQKLVKETHPLVLPLQSLNEPGSMCSQAGVAVKQGSRSAGDSSNGGQGRVGMEERGAGAAATYTALVDAPTLPFTITWICQCIFVLFGSEKSKN